MTSQAELAPNVPKPKTVKLDKVLSLAASLETLLKLYVGQVIDNQLAIRLANNLAWQGPWASHLSQDVAINMQNTMLQYVGETVTPRMARIITRQLASHQYDLEYGLLAAYTQPIRSEWVYVEVATLTPCTWRDCKPGAELQLDCLTGHPAGHLLKLRVPTSWLRFLAYRIGFTRKIQYNDEPRMFVGLRFMGYLTPKVDSTEAVFADWFITKALRNHNSQIIKLRTRFEYGKAECTFNYEHDCWTCDKAVGECPASYLRNQI